MTLVEAAEGAESRVASPTVARRILLIKLNELVKGAGRSHSELGRTMGVNGGTLGRWLAGEKQNMRPADVLMLLTALGLEHDAPLTQQLIQLTLDARQRGLAQERRPWMEQNRLDLYVGLESGAHTIVDVEPLMVPGLLQTAGYAEAIIRAAEPGLGDAEVAERVEFRIRRQEVLRRRKPPLQFTAVLGEAVLRTPIADANAWREQLNYLADAVSRPNVTLQLIPFSAGPTLLGETGPFVLLDFTDDVPPVAYSETPAQAYYVETPAGIARYRSVVNQLAGAALHGDDAVAVITDALRAP